MFRKVVLLAFVLLASVEACAPPTSGTTPADSRNVLSRDEMLQAGYPDAFGTVQSLRPQWLQRRGTTSLRGGETIKVYLDGSLMGGPDQLRQIMTQSIANIRFLDGLEASERWGLDHGAGAIVVSTRVRVPGSVVT